MRGDAARSFGTSVVVDVGTSAVKAASILETGEVTSQAEVALAPPSGRGGWAEQEPVDWERASQIAIRDVVAQGTQPPVRLILTGQMQDLTLTDAVGRPLRPSILYSDTRAQDEVEEVLRTLGVETVASWTGNETDASSLLAKSLWVKRHAAEAWEVSSHVFLGAADYLAFRLTGTAVCDVTTASTTGLMGLEGRAFLRADWAAKLGLEALLGRLPRLAAGGGRVGTVRPEMADAWGVPAGVPVHVAPGDAAATTIGAGAGEPGVASLYLGTSGWLAFTSTTRGRPEAGVHTLAHPRDGAYVQIAPLLTAAGNLAWAQREFAAELSIDTLLAAAEGPAPNLVFLPYLGGERSPFRDTSVRGAFLGITSHTTRADFLFALLEGVAFAFRHAAEVLGVQASGPHDRPWVVSGGGARSHTWMQRFADVLRRPLTRLDDAATVGLRGAWHSAVVAEGHVDSYALVSSGTTVTPSDEHASERAAREARYRAFRAATDALRPVYADWRAELDEVGIR